MVLMIRNRPRARVAHGRKGPKKAGGNKGVWGEAPAGFGAAAPGLSPRRANSFNRRGRADAHFALRLGSGGQKKLLEAPLNSEDEKAKS
jgi:hypothetical protein